VITSPTVGVLTDKYGGLGCGLKGENLERGGPLPPAKKKKRIKREGAGKGPTQNWDDLSEPEVLEGSFTLHLGRKEGEELGGW